MNTLLDPFEQLRIWLDAHENEHLEFKEAKNRYDFEELVKYCVALANEGGGKIIFGVTDRHPRQIVGTKEFPNSERTKAALMERLHLRIEIQELHPKEGRVLIFHVPSRPEGVPVHYRGAYFMRAGDSLVPMTPDVLKRILDELEPDFSAELHPRASLSDVDPEALARFRKLWQQKSGNGRIEKMSIEQLLVDAELMAKGKLTYAALILLGTHRALGQLMGQAEVIFEYRSSEVTGPAQQRTEYRMGFFLFYDEIWKQINLRNDAQHVQNRFVMREIRTFNERAVREAILNAVSHRDYRMAGSIFVRQFPQKLEVVSPGGLPSGIDPQNILWRQAPRNRRLAEIFVKCGLVERAGQGMNRMFEEHIREGKSLPDFRGTDAHWVSLTLWGEVREPQFFRFFEELDPAVVTSFITEDFLVLDLIYREQPVPEFLKLQLPSLLEHGIVESIGQRRNTKYILSRRFYESLGKKGVYTRKKGLDRDTHKALLLTHIKTHQTEGSPLRDLMQVLPHLSEGQVQILLKEMKDKGLIHKAGHTKGARWYSFPKGSQLTKE